MPDSLSPDQSPARWLWSIAVAGVLAVALLLIPAAADARRTIRVEPGTSRVIRGDVLWMRVAGNNREPLYPFAIHYGFWCWAPPSVFEEGCTMEVTRRRHGRRTLYNRTALPDHPEMGVAIRVTYTRRW